MPDHRRLGVDATLGWEVLGQIGQCMDDHLRLTQLHPAAGHRVRGGRQMFSQRASRPDQPRRLTGTDLMGAL